MREAASRPPRRAVHVVDDDAQMRRAIWLMLDAAGYAPRVFVDGEDLLAELDHLPPAPLLLDICMPGLNGFELMMRVRRRAPAVPVIMVTANGDIQTAVRAMKDGAVDFLEKPFGMHVLLYAVDAAAGKLSMLIDHDGALRDARRRIAELSAREREVLDALVAGKSNKVIAYDLDLSIRTVEMHRVRMMRRLDVRTLPEALRAHLADPPGPREVSAPGHRRRRAA